MSLLLSSLASLLPCFLPPTSLKMQNILLTLFLAVAFATRTVVEAGGEDGPTDLEIQKLSLAKNNPPYKPVKPDDSNQVGWKFPNPKVLKSFNEAWTDDDNCSIFVKVDVVSGRRHAKGEEVTNTRCW